MQDPSRPLSVDEVAQRIPARPPLKEQSPASKEIGVHSFPSSITSEEVPQGVSGGPDSGKSPQTDSFVPDTLWLRATPESLPAALQATPRMRLGTARFEELPEGLRWATAATPVAPETIFFTDDRVVFSDTSYPWSACGRVETPNGSASGVMVGPRHMLTCSHVIQWNSDGSVGWVTFTPSYFDGSAPFGVAAGIHVFWMQKVMGPTIDSTEGQFDYVAVVLDSDIGNQTGWLGSKTWSDGWDGQPFWYHVGYPGDLHSGQRPTYQSGISLTSSGSTDHTEMTHQGDVWPGQSGGPYFAWWDGEGGPSVVADQSGQTTDFNTASGGGDMVRLIQSALQR